MLKNIVSNNKEELIVFEKKLGYVFKNKELLKIALTHTSYANDNKLTSNEKLEFLGDSILEFVISNYLYKNYSNLKEGEMTKIRATVVCENSLYDVAIQNNFNNYIFLGKSEKASFGDKKPAILADSVEAVIAAIFMDSNLENAEKFILLNLEKRIIDASKNVGMKDYKTVLQEELQKKGNVKIEYNVIEESGPDHNKKFVSEVICQGEKLAIGKGKTKKESETNAAKNALKNLRR